MLLPGPLRAAESPVPVQKPLSPLLVCKSQGAVCGQDGLGLCLDHLHPFRQLLGKHPLAWGLNATQGSGSGEALCGMEAVGGLKAD